MSVPRENPEELAMYIADIFKNSKMNRNKLLVIFYILNIIAFVLFFFAIKKINFNS